MPRVKCPKCGTQLAVKQLPASGRVKCPQCAAVLSLGAPKPAAGQAPDQALPQPTAQAQPAQPLTTQPAAAQPLGGPPVPSQGAALPQGADPFDFAAPPGTAGASPVGGGGIDFGGLPSSPAGAFPSSPTSGTFPAASPVAQSGGFPAPHAAAAAASDSNDEEQSEGIPKIAIFIGAGIAAFLLFVTFIGFTIAMSGQNRIANEEEAAEAAAAENPAAADLPPGWNLVEKMGVTVAMPVGEEIGDIPGSVDGHGIMSMTTENIFFFAVEGANKNKEATSEGSRKKCARLVGGEVLGGSPCERNGYEGFQGVLDQSLFLPRMQMELLTHDGRFVIVGYSTATLRGGGAPNPDAGEEVDQFLKSIQINEYKGGWFF